MESITIIYSLICVAIAVSVNRGAAVGILVLSTLLWPDYIRFPLLGIQMSAPRLVALALLFKYRKRDRKQEDRFHIIDKLIVAEFVWNIVANTIAGAGEEIIKPLIGRGLDTLVVYFAVRYTIRDKADLKGMIKPLLICGIALGGVGIYEAVTYYSPYQPLLKYNNWMWIQRELEYRVGFLRARASNSHPLYFGMSMFIVTGLLLSLRDVARQAPEMHSKRLLWTMGLLCSILGTASSLSSGPIISIALLLAFNATYYKVSIIKPAVSMVFLLMIGMELLSHRHFYNLIDYLALDGATAYYRSRLLEVAVNQLYEYWLFGFGGVSPAHWGMMVDGRTIIDIVNNYVIVATTGGLAALFIFVAIQVLCFKRAVLFWKTEEYLKIFGFGTACLLLSFMLGTISVGVFGPMLIFSYLVYGLLSSPLDIKDETLRNEANPSVR
jgi:hypothetical protein